MACSTQDHPCDDDMSWCKPPKKCPPPTPPKVKCCYPCKKPYGKECPIFVSAIRSSCQVLPVGDTTVIFDAVHATSHPTPSWLIYNPSTGVFTTPYCGGGLYTISAHVNVTNGETQQVVLVKVLIAGTVIGQSTLNINPTLTKSADITLLRTLQPGQTVSVVVTTTENASVSIPGTTLGIIRNVATC